MVILIPFFFDRIALSFFLPITLLLMVLTYIQEVFLAKHVKVNLFFVLSIGSLFLPDFMVYTDFVSYFAYICVSIVFYAVFTSLSLKEYLNDVQFYGNKKALPSLIIGVGLLFYVIFSVSNLILELIPDAMFAISLTVIALLVYTGISYIIYISDSYVHGIRLLISAILSQITIGFTVINELFLLNPIATALIMCSHIFGLYIFLRFLVDQDPHGIEYHSN